VRKTPTFWATAVAVALAVPTFAQEPAKDHVKELVAQALQQAGQTAPAVQPLPAQVATAGTPLSADDAVRRALERNLDIQVQRLEPELLDYQVAALWATYRPSLTGSLFTQGATNLPTSQLQSAGGSRITNDTNQWNAGMQQNLRWGGGNLALNFNNTRLETSDLAATRNPAYTSNVQAQKFYTFERTRDPRKVRVTIEFRNEARAGLGMPLPKGVVRVYKEDKSGAQEFVGEDRIDHTAKDETVRMAIGNAFDVTGEYRQVDQRRISDKEVESSHEIKIRNHKTEAITVKVVEHAWGDWRVTTSSGWPPTARKRCHRSIR